MNKLARRMEELQASGTLNYVRPISSASSTNTKVIDKPRDAVWNAAVPSLGKQFFVVNNLDKASGFINLSYSGNPEAYIDCGRITSQVTNARGERTYDFPAAKADQTYELIQGVGLFTINRRMSLEGRINLVFEEIAPNQTRVTATTRYGVTRSQTIQQAGGGTQSASHSISFNSNSSATFPPARDGRSAECVATGRLEQEILSSIN